MSPSTNHKMSSDSSSSGSSRRSSETTKSNDTSCHNAVIVLAALALVAAIGHAVLGGGSADKDKSDLTKSDLTSTASERAAESADSDRSAASQTTKSAQEAEPAKDSDSEPKKITGEEATELSAAWERIKELKPEHADFVDEIVKAQQSGNADEMKKIQADPRFQEVLMVGLRDEQCKPHIEKILPEDFREQLKEMMKVQDDLKDDPEAQGIMETFQKMQSMSEDEQKDFMKTTEFREMANKVMTQDKFKKLKEFALKQQAQAEAQKQ